MRDLSHQLLSSALAFAIIGSPTTGCQAAPRSPSSVVADSVRDFSGKQGASGWSYGYWDRSADVDKTYDPATDFQLLRHFGRDAINGLSGHPEVSLGELWYLEDGVYYTSLWPGGGHPHGILDLGDHAKAEQWAVRRWISTIAGAITITGHAGKMMPWGKNWSGGVKVLIVVDGKTLYSADIEDGGGEYSIQTQVELGSRVDFLIGPNPSIGVIDFTATLQTTPPLPP